MQFGGCGASYLGYQGPSFAPSVIMLTSSTTGVSGEEELGTSPGGLVRAILPRRESFRILDFTGKQSQAGEPLRGYVEPNVPCGQKRVATWYFGQVTLDNNTPLLGWISAKVQNPLPPDPQSTPNRVGATDNDPSRPCS